MPRRRPAQSTHGSPYALADHPSTSLKTAHHCPSRIDFPDRCKKEIGFGSEASTVRRAPAERQTGVIWAEESGGGRSLLRDRLWWLGRKYSENTAIFFKMDGEAPVRRYFPVICPTVQAALHSFLEQR